MREYNLKKVIKELKECGFTCEAGDLKDSVAFQWLEKLVENDPTSCKTCEGKGYYSTYVKYSDPPRVAVNKECPDC